MTECVHAHNPPRKVHRLRPDVPKTLCGIELEPSLKFNPYGTPVQMCPPVIESKQNPCLRCDWIKGRIKHRAREDHPLAILDRAAKALRRAERMFDHGVSVALSHKPDYGYTMREIADTAGLSEDALRMRVKRGRHPSW